MKITEEHLDEVARTLIPSLNRLAGKVSELPPPEPPESRHPCAAPQCPLPGSLSRAILGPETDVVEARLLICGPHREIIEGLLAHGPQEHWKIKGRPILALNPETIRLGTLEHS